MAELPLDKIQDIIHRFEDLETKMSSNPDPETYVALASEYSELQEVVEKGRAYLSGIEEMADLRSITADQDADDDLQDMAETELAESGEKVEQLSREIRKLLLPQDAADSKNAILEIRAGTGGSEAALFAGDLFRMYERYAANRNWGVEVLSVSDGDVGGYKEIIARISGRGVFSRLKFESGVHRVQRVPETESGGRVHTSAATVAVLPEAEEVDVEIRNEDIRIDTMRASGAGGQHVNTTDSAVRITHIPSGIVVVQAEKSQHQNRARAMQILRSRLYDLERQRTDDERSEARRSQVGSGDRSERVRTYNFPQGRVTDHRINMTLYKLDRMMLGEIDEMIDGLTADFQAGQLASVGNGN